MLSDNNQLVLFFIACFFDIVETDDLRVIFKMHVHVCNPLFYGV